MSDATTTAVVQDAQHSARNEARLALHLLDRVWRGKDVDVPDDYDPEVVVAAYIERLEAENDDLTLRNVQWEHRYERAEDERIGAVKRYKRAEEVNAALLAEHEAVGNLLPQGGTHLGNLHDNAERVIHGEVVNRPQVPVPVGLQDLDDIPHGDGYGSDD